MSGDPEMAPLRPLKQLLIGRKLPNVRPDLVGTDPGHPAMFMRGPEPEYPESDLARLARPPAPIDGETGSVLAGESSVTHTRLPAVGDGSTVGAQHVARPNRLGLGVSSAPRGGLFRGLTQPEPEEPADGEVQQEATCQLEDV